MILIVGGARDPNIRRLAAMAESQGIEHKTVLVGQEHSPMWTWQLDNDSLLIDGESIHPDGVYTRYDVFEHLSSGRPQASHRALGWYSTVVGWVLAHPTIRTLNRDMTRRTSKLQVLRLARQLGLDVPQTVVTNDVVGLESRASPDRLVAKPTAGGDHCHPLDDLLSGTPRRESAAATPAIVQERLEGADIRVYICDETEFVFRIEADTVDFRMDDNPDVQPLEPGEFPDRILEASRELMRLLGLHFAALDFKLRRGRELARGGDIVFLEINSAPMFSGLDRLCDGRISRAILSFLARTTV